MDDSACFQQVTGIFEGAYDVRMLGVGVIIGIPTLLTLGAVYGVLSPRGWAVGMIAWVAVLLLWASTRKEKTKKYRASGVGPGTMVDDGARKRMLRDIRKWKVWIGALAVLLPAGIANGITRRAWLPTVAGVGISLLLIYVGVREIRQRRKRLGLTRE